MDTRKLIVSAFLILLSHSSFAVLPSPLLTGPIGLKKSAALKNLDLLRQFTDNDTYQIGDVWGKKEVTEDALKTENVHFQRLAKATASYSGMATGFYIGKFNGEHIVASNYHVTNPEDGVGCFGRRLRFPFLANKSFRCKKLIGNWAEVDLGFIAIDVPQADEELLASVAQNLNFEADVYPGQELVTIGFGIANNPYMRMMANQDNDCKVYSAKNEFKQIVDPDMINPADYRAWSFSHGCDVSHGDSGSAIIDKYTGDVIGLLWTSAAPKTPEVRTRAFLDGLKPESPEVWTKLSYGIPVKHAKIYILDLIKKGDILGENAKTLTAILH